VTSDAAPIRTSPGTDLSDWRRLAPSEIVQVGGELGMDEFGSEDVLRPRTGRGRHWLRGAFHEGTVLPLVTGIAVVEALALFAMGIYLSGILVAPTGTLVIDSQPPGAQILIDGEPRGITPTQLRLAEGAHAVELRVGDHMRGMALHVGRNETTRARLDVVTPPPPVTQQSVEGVEAQ
jgi:hypothetical protein